MKALKDRAVLQVPEISDDPTDDHYEPRRDRAGCGASSWVSGDAGAVLEPSTTAADVDGWDSVSNIEVMIALEREFGIRFSTGEMATLQNMSQHVERIALHLGTG